MSKQQGTFVWFELRTPSTERSARFYGEVVGWKREKMAMGGEDFTLFSNGKETVAHVQPQEGTASFVSYVAVDDVDAAAKRVTKAGGKLLGEAVDLPSIGRMIEVSDPDGAVFYLFKSSSGAGQPEGPGGFVWNELWAKAPQKALAFLTSVLGYSVDAMPMGGFTYNLLKHGDKSLAGVMPTQDASTAWVPYIHVQDVDAARTRAQKLGAKPLGDAMDVDGVGRMAVLLDPEGARFAIMTPAR